MTAHTPDGGGLTEAEREALVARALFDHDWLGSTDKNREAVWLMHRDAYVDKARAVMPVIARIVAAEHDGCADLLDAASEAILAARSAPDTEAVAAALSPEDQRALHLGRQVADRPRTPDDPEVLRQRSIQLHVAAALESAADDVPEWIADRVTWGDGTEYIAAVDVQRELRDRAAGVREGRA